VLMRLVFAALIYNFGFTSGVSIATHDAPARAASWAGLGAGLFVLATTFALELPSPRMPTQALKSGLLELLPLSRLSKLILVLAQALLMLPLALGLALTLRGELAPQAGVVGALALGLALYLAFALAGAALGKLVKLLFSAYGASRLSWLSALPMLLGLLLLQVGHASGWLPAPFFGEALGRALVGQQTWPCVAALSGVTALLGAAFFRLEGYQELSEPVRPGNVASALSGGADMPRLERLLSRREPGGTFQVPLVALLCAAFIGFSAWSFPPRAGVRLVWNMSALFTLQLVSSLGMQRATRSATRDMLARPLLGALPITPRDTLASKARSLRRTLFFVAAPLLLVLLAARREPAALPELGWRLLVSGVAVAVYASAAVYVAFLSAGLGATRPRGGVFGSLESFLLAVPFASVLFAPGPGSALLSLVTLGALTFEARRAARGTIDWLDDPEREHATEVWKALVVFGGFQGAQVLTQQLASLFGDWLSGSQQLLGAYSLAALGLWAMTQREQERAVPSFRWRRAPLGLAAGALSGAFAWLYLRLLPPTLESAHEGATRLALNGVAETSLAVLAIAIAAPLVEERFFRGWLQPALASALGPRRRLAPVLAALAFAIAHPAYSFLPVLVLGLLNGLLMQRSRSLSACMVAHAVHNACALWLGSR